MADQSVKIKLGMDTSDALREFDALVKKVQAAANKLNVNLGPGGSTGSGAPQSAAQQTQASNQKNNQEKVAQEAINKGLASKELAIQKVQRAQDNSNKSLEKEIQLTKELARAQQGLETIRNVARTARQQQLAYNQNNNDRFNNAKSVEAEYERGRRRGGGGGGGGDGGGGGGSGGSGGGMGWPSGKSITGILAAAGTAMNYIGGRSIDVARMQSSAISLTTGRQQEEARTGQYTYESMYGGDRAKANSAASSASPWKTGGDIMQIAASVGAILAAVPVGAATFGVGGVALAGLGAAGLKSAFYDKGMADPEKYGAYRAQRTAQDFTDMLNSQHEMDPYRKSAIELERSTGGRNLSMSRALGLKDFGSDQFPYAGGSAGGYFGNGGYLKGNMDLGFTDEQVTGSSQGILGAGGSTAMAKMSGISLQAQRGLGLNNSDQLLGQLSGTQGIPETSKKALIDIFARGFDTSKFATENEKYMQAVTSQVYQGGSTGLDSVSKIADMMRSAIGETPTSRKIEGAQTAFEAFQKSSSSLSGYGGGINVSSAMQDSILKQVKDPAEFEGLISMPTNSISENDRGIIDSASRMKGVSPAQLAERLRKLQMEAANKKLNRGENDSIVAQRRMASMTGGIDPSNIVAQDAYLDMIHGNGAATSNPVFDEMQRKKYGGAMADKTGTGRAEDTKIQADSENAKVALQTLSESINKFTSDALTAAQKLGGDVVAAKAAAAKAVNQLTPQELSDAIGKMDRSPNRQRAGS